MWYIVWRLLQPQPWHPIIIQVRPYPNFSKFGHLLHRYYSIRVAPICPFTAYQGEKHFLYIQYGCGIQSGASCGLNHDTTISFGLGYTPNFQNLAPTPHRYYTVRVNPYAHSQHIKVLKHIVYIQYGCGMQSEASCSLNHDTPASFGFTHTPVFKNFAPTPLTGITV